jgi:hypothetical protein
MAREIWYAQDGNIWISGTYLPGGSNWTAQVKEISITGGGRDIEGVRCLGSGTNFYVFEKGAEIVEMSLTTVKQTDYLAATIMGGSQTYNANAALTLTGDSLRYPVTMLYNFHDRFGTNNGNINIKMANAYCTGKEMSLAVDGHLEETFTFKCAPESYQEEYALNAGSLTLTL